MTERYRKILQRRRISSACFGLLGAVILLVVLLARPGAAPRSMETFFVATGFAALANGAVNFYRKGKLLQNEEALRRAAVLEFDERNAEVMRRSCALTLDVLLLLLWVGMVAAGFLNQTVCYTLLAVLGVGLVVWFVCYGFVWKTL